MTGRRRSRDLNRRLGQNKTLFMEMERRNCMFWLRILEIKGKKIIILCLSHTYLRFTYKSATN